MRTFLDLPAVIGLIDDATSVTRLEGGSTKGVYRVTRAGGETLLIYRWHPDENFWPARTAIDAGPFGGAPRQSDFLSCHQRLTALGVRVPEILGLHGDLALIEDVRGGKLEQHLDGEAAAELLARLRATLLTMHAHRGAAEGRPEDHALERGRRALAETARRVPEIAVDGDFPRPELMREIAAGNLERVLADVSG